MNEFVPRGYLTLEKALEHFGRLKYAGDWETKKDSSKQEFRQLLFEGTLSAKLFTDYGVLKSLPSRDWGSVEAERIFETGRASISVGNEYFPDTVHGPVLIEQSSIDALDDDSDDPSQSPEAISDGELTAEANAPGRPSLKTEIENACNELITNEKAILDSRKPNYEPIRQIIREKLKKPPDAEIKGLTNEAIRTAIAPILDDAKAASHKLSQKL